jgi:sporulation protein YlmC with PRC-barrel domain
MKRLTSGLIALAFLVSIPAAGLAQTSGTGSEDRRVTDKRAKKDRPAWSNTQGLHEHRDLLGAKVQTADGKELGELEALLIDPKDGKITHAVIGYGGRLGIAEEKVVVPYSAMKMAGHEGGRGKAKITMDQSALENAPKYVKARDRAPSASPATSPRTDTTTGGGVEKRDADGRPLGDKPDTKKPDTKKSDTEKPKY